MSTELYTVSVTIGQTVGLEPVWTAGDVLAVFEAHVSHDYTATNGLGKYTHDDGRVVHEASVRIECAALSFAEALAVLEALPAICDELRQECVVWECKECTSALVYGRRADGAEALELSA